mmetsp:Transcript_6596/g.16818  ORF Transcript_6596/g.16818 Transcript_6596/m.16818 type:complete len:220 (+) Transcript_6596:3-662(+)
MPLSSTLHGPAVGGNPGIGPMRVWPGGLCVGRAIGDDDVGFNVLADPHIKQMRIPDTGARFALATDGVWDGISHAKAGKLLQSNTLADSAKEVVRHALMHGGLTDDTSIVTVDVVPSQVADFSDIIPQASGFQRMMCLVGNGGTVEEPSLSSLAHLFISADMAGWDSEGASCGKKTSDVSSCTSADSSQHLVHGTALKTPPRLPDAAIEQNDISLRSLG